MNYSYSDHDSRMLHRYLDGELDQALEPGLFQSIAESPGLRDELRHYLAIRSALQRDSAAIAPAPHLKERLLASVAADLLPATPAITEVVVRSGGGWWNAAAWLLRWGALPVAAAFVATVVTVLHYRDVEDGVKVGAGVTQSVGSGRRSSSDGAGAMSPSVGAKSMSPSVGSKSTSVRSGGTSGESGGTSGGSESRSVGSEFDSDPSSKRAARSQTPSQRTSVPSQRTSVPSQRTSAPSQRTSTPNQASSVIPRSALAPTIRFGESAARSRAHDTIEAPATPFDPASVEEGSAPGIVLEARSYRGRSFPSIGPIQQDAPLFNDKSVAAYLMLGEHHRLGVIAARESFAQVFRRNENGEMVRYEQNPSLIWGGVAYRYRSGELFGMQGVRGFAEGIAGGTGIGGVGRLILGFDYTPEEYISLNFGVDGGLLLYREQGVSYTTRKLGVAYGISVAFGGGK